MFFGKCSLCLKRLTLLAGYLPRRKPLLGDNFDVEGCTDSFNDDEVFERETNAAKRDDSDDNLARSNFTKLFQALRLLSIKGAGNDSIS